MASPDLNSYFTLPFYDIDPQDAFEAGASHLRRAFPELVLREGQIETVLLEAVAEEVAESVYALNRLPDGIFEVLLKMFGISRDIGTLPIVNLTFIVNRTDGCTIPTGTSVSIQKPGGDDYIVFTTTEDLFIMTGESQGYVPALGNQYTSSANGVPANTPANLIDSIAFVDLVVTASEISGGRDAENDLGYLTRGAQRLSRLTSTLVLPAHFSAAALEQVYIERAFAIDNYNSSTDTGLNGPVGQDAGHITIAVYGQDAPVSIADKSALKELMKASALSTLVVHVMDAQIHPFDVSATIHVIPGYDTSTVVSNITAALKVRYSPAMVNWNEKIRRNDIISIISQMSGVAFVDSLTTPAADVIPPGVATLASLTNVNITVATS